MVYSQRANPGDVLLTFVNQLNYFYQCDYKFLRLVKKGIYVQIITVHVTFEPTYVQVIKIPVYVKRTM